MSAVPAPLQGPPNPAFKRRLRRDLAFRRIAIVLSGGGALGAYEVGTLKVIEALGIAPSLVAGVSIGAINAAVWVAHGRRSAALEACAGWEPRCSRSR